MSAYDVTPVTIKYGGVEIFENLSGTQPLPFVTRSQQSVRYGDHWTQLSTFDINGMLTGKNATMLFDNKDSIVDGFRKDFQSFLVEETVDNVTSTILDVMGVVRSINFGDSEYSSTLDYSIVLEAYEKDFFSGTWGILDPVDQISYSDNEEGYVDIVHSCSAKGFHTGLSSADMENSSALKNAKDFVFSRRETWKSKAKPIFATVEVDFETTDPMLISSNESINRFDGVYELSDTFRFSKTGTDAVITKQSVSVQSGIAQEAITVTVDGEIYAGKSGTLDLARTHLKNINIFKSADAASPVDLYDVPINLNIQEEENTNRINYSASYDNLPVFETGAQGDNLGAYYDYSVSLKTDEITNITSAAINGTIKGRGNIIDRRRNIENFYYTEMLEDGKLEKFLRTKAGSVYSSIVGDNYKLGIYPDSINVSSGNAAGEINVSANFSDMDFLSGYSEVSYSVSTKAAMPLRAINPSARFQENGFYMFTDLDLGNREETTINVNMTYNREFYAENVVANDKLESNSLTKNNAELKTLVAALAVGYTPIEVSLDLRDAGEEPHKVRLKNETLNENRDARSLSANYSYSYNGSNFQDTENNTDKTFMAANKAVKTTKFWSI